MAKLAVQQIETAFTTMRDGGDAHFAAFFEAKLPEPTASAGHLTIAVAHLDNDKEREHEKLLLDELVQFEGVAHLSVDRTVDPEQPDKKTAEEEARGLLRQTGADVLLWGSVISLSGKSAMRLYWTPARDTPGAKSTGKYQPQTETIALPSEFWNDLKQVLGLLTQSRIAAPRAHWIHPSRRHFVAPQDDGEIFARSIIARVSGTLCTPFHRSWFRV